MPSGSVTVTASFKLKAADDLAAFTDTADISGYALPAMRCAVAEGLVEGVGGGKIAPTGNANRAQLAAVLERYIEN